MGHVTLMIDMYTYHVEVLDHSVRNSKSYMEQQHFKYWSLVQKSPIKETYILHIYIYKCMYIHTPRSLLQKSSYFCRARLQKRPIFLGSLQSIATPSIVVAANNIYVCVSLSPQNSVGWQRLVGSLKIMSLLQ